MCSVAVIIVTHNSEAVMGKCLDALESQSTLPESVVIVDSGSDDTDYVSALSAKGYLIRLCQNIGFGAANNLGWALCRAHEHVVFLNPDAFLSPEFISSALKVMNMPEHSSVGAVSGTLLGYDIDSDKPTGLIDSTGIEQSWYGRFRDRDQRAEVGRLARYDGPEFVKALCGALMFCRNRALKDVARNAELFDASYFMYKEDIDLSWRLRKAGWGLLYDPSLWAYHCRGWKSRLSASRDKRLLSARNELKLQIRHRPVYVPGAILKYCLVRYFDL